MTSLSRSIYPGACAVIELGIWETSRTPFFLRSSRNSASSFFQMRLVRSVAVVGRVILLEEPAHVDVALPQAGFESAPGVVSGFRRSRFFRSRFRFRLRAGSWPGVFSFQLVSPQAVPSIKFSIAVLGFSGKGASDGSFARTRPPG